MSSGLFTSWQIDGEIMETVREFIFLGSKITADGDCSHEIKRCLLLGRKAMTKLDSILKSRHYFADKSTFIQSYGFSNSHVWMWELDYKESWAPKNWCFWTVVLEKILESPLDYKEFKQSVLKEISPEYSLEGLRLKLQYFDYLMQRGNKRSWRWERLKAGGGDNRGWDGWMTSLTQWTRVWASSQSWWWTGKPGVLQSMGSQRGGHDWTTELNWYFIPISLTFT